MGLEEAMCPREALFMIVKVVQVVFLIQLVVLEKYNIPSYQISDES